MSQSMVVEGALAVGLVSCRGLALGFKSGVLGKEAREGSCPRLLAKFRAVDAVSQTSKKNF